MHALGRALTLTLSLSLTLTLTWRPEGTARQQQQPVVCGELPYRVLLGKAGWER